MGWESFDAVRFDLQGQTRIAKLKSAYNSLIIGPTGLQCETNLRKSWARNLLMFRFDIGPLLQGQMRIAKLKVFITRLLLFLEVWNVKPTYFGLGIFRCGQI